MTKILYHLALASDWQAAQAGGAYEISTLGRTLAEEGFIHLSFEQQVDGVAERFYTNVTEPLLLLAIQATKLLHEIKLEAPPGADEVFPHLYGPLGVDAVVSAQPYVVSS